MDKKNSIRNFDKDNKFISPEVRAINTALKLGEDSGALIEFNNEKFKTKMIKRMQSIT